MTSENRPHDNKVLEITPSVKWIGVLDYDIVTFDVVMTTEYGTTYNSYFINADKKALIETTKEKFLDTYLAKLQQVCNPSEIEYIIVNHTEPDHSGNVANILHIAPNAKVVGSGQAIRYMKDLLGFDFPHLIVKDGDTLSLGNKTLRFISAPNLHWPDSMYTWLEDEKVLFTCDSFGAHYCDDKMFDHLVENYDDAFKYYFDVILKPYSKFMLKAIEKIRNLDISAVCTGHGPLLTTNWKRYIDLSEKYAKEALAERKKQYVFIPYVSAYQKTGAVAKAIAKGIQDVIPDAQIDGKVGGVFGSYGWSGEASNLIYANLKNLKLDVPEESFFVKFTMHDELARQAMDYGKKIAELMLSKQCSVEE